MIAKSEIKDMMITLGFEQSKENVYVKKYNVHNDYKIEIDIDKEKINYGEKIKLGDTTTCNFSNSENFVVLECVDRLLSKNYNPEDIYLEKRWQLGRREKGKADIVVSDKNGKTLFIIECKTWGTEYEKEMNKMFQNGGQLFSYLQQDKGTRYLCLYTSRFIGGVREYISGIVKIEDNKDDIDAILNGLSNVKTYKFADTGKELFEVWKETHNLYVHYNGIFEDDIEPYNIELKPLKLDNLKHFKHGDSGFVYNQLMEILRHNNVSDISNAFNRINALILAKVVDETTKRKNQVLDFQYKEGVDTYESLQERLMNLYHKGMTQYLGEEMIDASNESINRLLERFPDQSAKLKLKEMINELKYYKNNEFAFLEVYNEPLFEKNTKILIEIVKLLQNYKFSSTHKEQFLGDFFELLLNSGYKQSAGQYFTTVIIARFILSSLPIKEIIIEKLKSNKKDFLPYILDFACGSGHFLTEAIDEVDQILNGLDGSDYDLKLKNKLEYYKTTLEWAKEYIVGIEKDSRLARTTQVACLLNGTSIEVIAGDGLENHAELPKKFDILVANPPYSIYAFKQYLNIKDQDFELLKYLTNESKEIEVLFLERAKQLLRVGGVAGIILPSSILSNMGVYTKARELILKYFEIISIVDLGTNTFMATGTTTVILFLRRRDDNISIDMDILSKDIIVDNKERKNDFIDSEFLLRAYTSHIDIEYDVYKTLLNKAPNEKMMDSDIFKNYKKWFNDLTEIKNYKNTKSFKKMDEKDQNKELDKLFYSKVLDIEKNKFYFFTLTYNQNLIMINSGKDAKEEKEFLGYEFSNRRGNEGIQIYKDSIYNKPTTKLFDAPVPTPYIDDKTPEEYKKQDHLNSNKVNSYILKNFLNEPITEIDEGLQGNIKQVNLVDCIDFDRVDFDKQISLVPKKKILIDSNWPQVKLGDLATLVMRGKSPKYGDGKVQVIKSGQIRGFYEFDFSKEYYLDSKVTLDDRKLQKNDILINSTGVGTAGRVNLFNIDGDFVVDSHVTIVRLDTTIVKPKYILYALSNIGFKTLESMALGQSGQIELPIGVIENIRIPVPPMDVQEKMVKEYELFENKLENYKSKIEVNNLQINNLLHGNKSDVVKKYLDDVCSMQSGGTPSKKEAKYWESGTIPWLRSEVCNEKNKVEAKEFITELGLEKSSAKILKANSTLIALVGATKGKTAYLDFEATTNQNIVGLYPYNDKELLPKYLYYSCKTLYNEFEKLGKYKMASVSFIKGLQIDIIPYEKQKQIIDNVENLEDENKKMLEEITDKDILIKSIFLKYMK